MEYVSGSLPSSDENGGIHGQTGRLSTLIALGDLYQTYCAQHSVERENTDYFAGLLGENEQGELLKMENTRIRYKAANSALVSSHSQSDINADLDNDDEDKLVIVEDPKEELEHAQFEKSVCDSPKLTSTVEEHKFRGHKKKILAAYCQSETPIDSRGKVHGEVSPKSGSLDTQAVSSDKIGSSDVGPKRVPERNSASDSNEKAEQKACDSTKNDDEDPTKKGQGVPMFNLRSCIDLIIDSRLIRDKLNSAEDVLNEEYNIKVSLSRIDEGNTVRELAKSRADCKMLRSALHSNDQEELDSMHKTIVHSKAETPGMNTQKSTVYPSSGKPISNDTLVSQSSLPPTYDCGKPYSPGFVGEPMSSHQETESPLHQIAALASLLPKQPVSGDKVGSSRSDIKSTMLKTYDLPGVAQAPLRIDNRASSSLESFYDGHRPRSWSDSNQTGRQSQAIKHEKGNLQNYASPTYSVHSQKLSHSQGQENNWPATTNTMNSQQMYHPHVPNPTPTLPPKPGYPPPGTYGFPTPQTQSSLWNTAQGVSPGPRHSSSIPSADKPPKNQPQYISNIRPHDPSKIVQSPLQSRPMPPLMRAYQQPRFPYKDIPAPRDHQTLVTQTPLQSSQQSLSKYRRDAISSHGRDYCGTGGPPGQAQNVPSTQSVPPKLIYIPDAVHMTRAAAPEVVTMSYTRSGTSSGGGIISTCPTQKWSQSSFQPHLVPSVQPTIMAQEQTHSGTDTIAGEAPLDLTVKEKSAIAYSLSSISQPPTVGEKMTVATLVQDDSPLDLTVKRPGDITVSTPSTVPQIHRSTEGYLVAPEPVHRGVLSTGRASPNRRFASDHSLSQPPPTGLSQYPSQGLPQTYVQQPTSSQTQLPPGHGFQLKPQTVNRFPQPSRSPQASHVYEPAYMAPFKDPKYSSYGSPIHINPETKQGRAVMTAAPSYRLDSESGTEKLLPHMQMRHPTSPNLQQQARIPTPTMHLSHPGPHPQAPSTVIPQQPPPPQPQMQQQQQHLGKAQTKSTSTAQLLGNHPLHDILYLKCNVCNSTHGSLHSFRKHFSKAHGNCPTNEHVTVRSISATRESASKTEKALDEIERPIVAEQVQGTPVPQMSPVNQASPESFASEEGYDMVHMQVQRPCTGGEMQHKMAPLSEANPVHSSDSKSPNSKPVDSSQSTMRCLQCGQDFPTRDWGVFRRHVRAHDQPQSRCSLCRQAFATNKELQDHNKTYHQDQMWVCRICGVGFSSTGALGKHMKSVHQTEGHCEDELKCQLCPLVFTDVRLLLSHLQEHKERPELTSQHAESLMSWSAVRRASPDSTNDVDQKLAVEQSADVRMEQVKPESENPEEIAETKQSTVIYPERQGSASSVPSPIHIGIQGKDLMAIIRDKVEQEAIKHLKDKTDDVKSVRTQSLSDQEKEVARLSPDPQTVRAVPPPPEIIKDDSREASSPVVRLAAAEDNQNMADRKFVPVPYKTVRDALNMLVERAVVDGCDLSEKKNNSISRNDSEVAPSQSNLQLTDEGKGEQVSEGNAVTQVSDKVNIDSAPNPMDNTNKDEPELAGECTEGKIQGMAPYGSNRRMVSDNEMCTQSNERLQENRGSPLKSVVDPLVTESPPSPGGNQKREFIAEGDPKDDDCQASPTKKARMDCSSS